MSNESVHAEQHFTSSEAVRDVVIGMSDGLTVPFALAAGLSGAVVGTHIIVTAGVAEIAAGAIAMGLGGYLSSRSESEHYANERKREEWEIVEKTAVEEMEVSEIFQGYGLTKEESKPLVDALKKDPKAWVDFMMRFELGLEEPDPQRAVASARNIAISYIVGGFIPLSPYIFLSDPHHALFLSAGVTFVALAGFGYVKGRFTGLESWKSMLQTTLIGGLAATAAYLIAKAFQ